LALEWAVVRYDNNQLLNPTHPENHNDFYERVADICGVVLEGPLVVAVKHAVHSTGTERHQLMQLVM
jgi:hypothetical protein